MIANRQLKQLFLLGMALVLTSFTVFSVGHATTADYQVSAQLPTSQINSKISYFDLKLKPNQRETLKLNLTNKSEHAITFKIQPNTATTNRNGVIDYSQAYKKTLSRTKYSMAQLIDGPRQVSVPANRTQTIDYQLTMPKQKLAGILLGAFYVTEKQPARSDGSKKNSVSINNRFAYAIGIQLTEKQAKMTPKLALGAVKPTLINYAPSVTAQLQNLTPTVIHKLHVTAKVKHDFKTVHTVTKSDLAVAPESNFDFPISWEHTALKAGHYTLDLTAKDRDGHQWHFVKKFTVTDHQATQTMKNAVGVKDTGFNWWLVGAAIVIVGLLAYIIWLRRSGKQR